MATIAAEPGRAGEDAAPRRLSLPRALPPLSDRGLRFYRIVWFLAVIAAVVGVGAGIHLQTVIRQQVVKPYSELGLRTASVDGTELGLPIGEETRRTGIVPKSRLVAIEGVRIAPESSQAEVAARLRAVRGEHVRVRIRLPDGTEREHRLRRTADHLKQAYAAAGVSLETKQVIETALSLLAALMMLGAAILLFRKAGRDPVASLLSMTLLISIMTSEPARSVFVYFDSFSLLIKLMGASGVALLLTMFVFPDGRFQSRWAIPAVGVYALISFFPSSNPVVAGVMVAVSCGIFLFALGSIASRYRRLEPSIQRQQIRWAFFGFAASFAVGLVYVALLLWGMFADDEQVRIWSLIGGKVAQHLSMMLLIGGILVALLRYRLYDAEAVISRSTGYAALTLMLGAAFTASSKAIEWVFETNFGRDAGAFAGAAGAAMAVLLITPLRKRVHGWAERRFQKALMDLRKNLPLCVGDLRETAGLEQLLGTVLARVASGVRAARTAVLLRDGGEWQVAASRDIDAATVAEWQSGWTPAPNEAGLDCNRRDPLFPLRAALSVTNGDAPETIGWILLGPRPDGSFYGKDEQEVLAEIADPIARAVQIVLLREAREAEDRQQIERLSSRIAALEAALATALQAITPKRRAGA